MFDKNAGINRSMQKLLSDLLLTDEAIRLALSSSPFYGNFILIGGYNRPFRNAVPAVICSFVNKNPADPTSANQEIVEWSVQLFETLLK